MPYHIRTAPKRRSKKPLVLLVIFLLIGLAICFYFLSERANAPDSRTGVTANDTASEEEATPAYEAIDLQPVVDEWVDSQAADYGIVVYDQQAKKIIGEHQADEVYFAASLYKIYVAYLALLDIQNGTMNPDEILSQGFTRKECIDKMIRESHSPCGEAMMADIGQAELNQRVKDMGMTGTFFNGIRTSAGDSALMLQHILSKRDLNEENTAFLRDAMLTQDAKFKRGLQTGAPDAKWETKVGWNETYNYHDIGIMTMPDGRVFAVVILSQGQGSSSPIADFAETIYAKLNK